MRTFIGVSLALVAAASAHSHNPTRKSLSFGSSHPHATFKTAPHSFAPQSFAPEVTDPYRVAEDYAQRVLGLSRGIDQSFVIRDDSYTDKNNGVSHIYIRQLVNGLEVVDGDVNLNILDGRVISFGNSFYHGATPDHSAVVDHCEDAEEQFVMEPDSQTIMGSQPHFQNACSYVSTKDGSSHTPGEVADPRVAALNFMIAAHPSGLHSHDLLENYDAYFKGISSTVETSLVGNHQSPVEILHNVPGTVNPVKAKLAYVQTPDPKNPQKTILNLVWRMEVEMQDNSYETTVDARHPTRILSSVDWVSDAPTTAPIPKPRGEGEYNVWKWGINDPTEGKRSNEKAPYDTLASPAGWHAIPANRDPRIQSSSSDFVNTTTTAGNNVFAHENWEGQNSWINNYRPEAGDDLVFDYKYGPNSGKDGKYPPKDYINLTITQLFYTTNMVHDLYYRYGFDEVSGNFQQFNFGRGGMDGDAVIANAQDGSGYNNANFMTPPDGQNGRMRMYVWNTAEPFRDGDLEAGIVIHELSHGLSTRLTGGPANSGCLAWGESGGMGEGWGDFLATSIRSNKEYSDYPMGSWAANEVNGIRHYPYSTDEKINPSTYKTLDSGGYWGVHAIGEVWAQMLWLVNQELIAKHGYSDTLFPPQANEDGSIPEGDFYRPREHDVNGKAKPLVPKHGNTLMVQLVLDGMKLQPCRPSFFQARDAIIQADQILTGGENACELWKGFTMRGLGADATLKGSTPWGGGIRKNGFAKPSGVCKD